MLSKRSLKTILGMIIILSICVISLVGCKGSETTTETKDANVAAEKAQGDVAALVNGQPISKSELEDALEGYTKQAEAAMGQHSGDAAGKKMDDAQLKEVRQNILNQMIDGELLYQAGKDVAVDVDKKVQERYDSYIKNMYGTEEAFDADPKKGDLTREKVKEQIKKGVVIDGFLEGQVSVSEDAVKKFYDENPKYFEHQEQVKASHILSKVETTATKEEKDAALAKIKKVQERLKKGEKFEDVAKEVSDCPSASNGGDLGFFSKEQMVKPFSDAAFTLKAGKLSDVVETQFGYHIIKAADKRGAGKTSLEEVKANIEEHLKKKELEAKVPALLKELKEKAKIEIK